MFSFLRSPLKWCVISLIFEVLSILNCRLKVWSLVIKDVRRSFHSNNSSNDLLGKSNKLIIYITLSGLWWFTTDEGTPMPGKATSCFIFPAFYLIPTVNNLAGSQTISEKNYRIKYFSQQKLLSLNYRNKQILKFVLQLIVSMLFLAFKTKFDDKSIMNPQNAIWWEVNRWYQGSRCRGRLASWAFGLRPGCCSPAIL